MGLPTAVACVLIIRVGNKLGNGTLFVVVAIVIVPAFYQYWRERFVKPMQEMIDENQSEKGGPN
jgi:hypothetical protein